MSTTPAPSLYELRELADRLGVLTSEALRACEEGATESVTELLRARQAIVERADELFAELRTVHTDRASPAVSGGASFDSIREAFAAAMRMNEELVTKARDVRSRIGAELHQVRTDAAAQLAYGSMGSRVSGVDLVR